MGSIENEFGMDVEKAALKISEGLPQEGTVEEWAWHYILTADLNQKRFPEPPPLQWESAPVSRRIPAPGRPPELEVIARSPRTPKPGALVRKEIRARLFHTFWHHELQAAELFAWALLAFPNAPLQFRKGLLGILLEEIDHMGLYERHLATLGYSIGDFPVRDWFWQRIPLAKDAAQFVALVGLGLEAGNLDHGAIFAKRFRAVGDEVAAGIIDQISRDEEGHVAFGAEWFPRLVGQGRLYFEGWRLALPAPLSPILFRGRPLDLEARRRAGFDEAFLDALGAWRP